DGLRQQGLNARFVGATCHLVSPFGAALSGKIFRGHYKAHFLASDLGRVMKLIVALIVAQIASVALGAETSREYPSRPVRLINPFPPGGSSDPSCRLLADALTRALGQQFVVDNRGGGNGNIGTAIAAKASPDG